MKKFLIEVPHGADKNACNEAIQVFQLTGSHFLTHAEWGCMDGEHKAWILVDVESKEDAMYIIPPLFRSTAKIVELTNFSAKELLEVDKFHED